MIEKSELRKLVAEVAEEHEVHDGDFVDDLVDRIATEFANEVNDLESEDDE